MEGARGGNALECATREWGATPSTHLIEWPPNRVPDVGRETIEGRTREQGALPWKPRHGIATREQGAPPTNLALTYARP